MKKTLIAMVAVVLLASVAQAALEVFNFGTGTNKTRDGLAAVKVEGSDNIRWPWEYKSLPICTMPVKMKIGMWVEVKECDNKKILLEQVPCTGDTGIGKGLGDFPCYKGCQKFSARANFDVKLGVTVDRNEAGKKILDGDKFQAYYDGDDTIAGDGSWHEVTVCAKAWKAKLYKGTPGDEVEVGTLTITAKPKV